MLNITCFLVLSAFLTAAFAPTTEHRTTEHRPPTQPPTDLPTGCHQFTLKQRPDSKYVLQSLILQNFHYRLVPVINEQTNKLMQFYVLI